MGPAEREVTLMYSEALLRKVAWACLRRAVGWQGILAFAYAVRPCAS
ncbi:MAG TPA: hypothetical protein VHB47_08475 [Thermoanaerobaculia bacterium]|nr:hypothetical protein [Thermoanaerobaculia bacterium]